MKLLHSFLLALAVLAIPAAPAGAAEAEEGRATFLRDVMPILNYSAARPGPVTGRPRARTDSSFRCAVTIPNSTIAPCFSRSRVGASTGPCRRQA